MAPAGRGVQKKIMKDGGPYGGKGWEKRKEVWGGLTAAE
jgi:hypothetical protein